MNKPIQIYLIRHGETEYNKLNKIQGWMDSPLTDSGSELARLVGMGLSNIKFDGAYSSDLVRAVRTMEIILKQNKQKDTPFTLKKGLREISFGAFGGKDRVDYRRACSKALYGKENLSLLDEQMLTGKMTFKDLITIGHSLDSSGESESYGTFVKRILETIETIFKQATEQGKEKILVVGHGLAIYALIKELAPEKVNHISEIQNASVTTLILENDSIEIENVGSMEYVETGKRLKNNQRS